MLRRDSEGGLKDRAGRGKGERKKEIPSGGEKAKRNLWDLRNSLVSGHAVAGTAGN